MNRGQLAHALRAAARALGDRQFVVVGSAAILGSFPEGLMTQDLMVSTEVDILPPDDPDETKAMALDGGQGELSLFHQTHGFYIDGVSALTSRSPTGWQERVVPFAPEDADGAIGWCLSPQDLIATKAVVGRAKDRRFVSAALRQRLVDADEVLALIPTIDAEMAGLRRAAGFVNAQRPVGKGTMRPDLDTSGVENVPLFEPEHFRSAALVDDDFG